MSLVVSRLDFDNSGQRSCATQERIKAEIEKFWDGKTTAMHTFVDTTK